MENTITNNAISASLLARNVYGVCFPQRDTMDALHSEFAAAREKFFTGGRKRVRVGRSEVVQGFDGKLKGKVSRRGLYWKKTAAGMAGGRAIALEEAFDQRGGHVLVRRDFRDIIVSRTFFDKGQIWLKSEYYEPWDAVNARVIFKPSSTEDTVERFDWDGENKRYRSTLLYPVPYLAGTPEQSILGSRFGPPPFLVSTGEGEFCYCPKEEAQARKKALEDIQGGTIVLMPAWEVKDGALAQEEGEEEADIAFPSLEEYAVIPPKAEAVVKESPAEEPSVEEAAVEEPAVEEAAMEEAAVEETAVEESAVEEAAVEETALEETAVEEAAVEETAVEEAAVEEAAVEETAVEETAVEETAVEETAVEEPAVEETAVEETAVEEAETKAIVELAHRQEEGTEAPRTEEEEILAAARQAAHAAEDEPEEAPQAAAEVQEVPETADKAREEAPQEGALAHAGEVEKPQGIQIAGEAGGMTAYRGEYQDGKRHGFGAAYYKDGSLSYAGFWKEGKKDGLGVSFRDGDHALHIARWENGKPGGFVSLFDSQGSLRYSGRFVNGKKQGAGVTVNPADGTLFVGKWQDGEATGVGSAFDQEGNLLYYGGWKDGKRHGQGTEFDKNGAIVFDGEWRDGKYHNGILYQKLVEDGESDGPDWDL